MRSKLVIWLMYVTVAGIVQVYVQRVENQTRAGLPDRSILPHEPRESKGGFNPQMRLTLINSMRLELLK